MKRLQIYLEENIYEALRHAAFEAHKSIAQIVREAVEAFLRAPAAGSRGARSIKRDDEATGMYAEFARVAEAEHKPVALVMREALARYTTQVAEKEPVAAEAPGSEVAMTPEELELQKNPLYHLIGLYHSGKPDAAEHHDYYLYVEDRD